MVTVLDRLAALHEYLDHLRALRSRVTDPEALRGDLSLSNNVCHSLQVICQAVIDIAGDLSVRRQRRFESYSAAIQNLSAFSEFPAPLVRDLEVLPELRDSIVHRSWALDYARLIEALDHLQPIEQFAEIVRQIEAAS